MPARPQGRCPAARFGSGEDAFAIMDYLKSIEPINFRVPENVPQGQRTTRDYVHFGVYRSR
jgi:hypothetical protein